MSRNNIKKIIQYIQNKKRDKTVQPQTRKTSAFLSQTGRSMLEMLSVLALIGILSLGALMGYQYAISKYHANDSLNEINMRAIVGSQQLMVGKTELSFDDLKPHTKSGSPISVKLFEGDKDHFYVLLESVPVRVCEIILTSGYKAPSAMFVGQVKYQEDVSICGKEKITALMMFEFPAEFSKGLDTDEPEVSNPPKCRLDMDCATCEVCQAGVCVPKCPEGKECAVDEKTREEVCCLSDKIVDGTCCAIVKNGVCCESETNCCPPNKPLGDDYDTCHSCDTPIEVYATSEVCLSTCKGERVIGARGLCIPACPSDKPLMDEFDACHSCSENASVLLQGMQERCAEVCGYQRVIIYEDSCVLSCPKEKPLMASMGRCYSCDDPEIIQMSTELEDNCEKACAGKRILLGGNKCVLHAQK